VLDLGCGWGDFVNQIRAQRKFGMDLNASSRDHLNGSVVFLNQDCSTHWTLADNSLVTIFTSNLFENLPDKQSVRASLVEAFRCFNRDGESFASDRISSSCQGPTGISGITCHLRNCH
jgi:hypothetical protein